MFEENKDESADGNGVVDVEPTDDAAEEDSVYSDDQEQKAEPSDGESVNAGDSNQIASDDGFVDCPDEIETSEPQLALEGKDDQEDAEVEEIGNGAKVDDLMAEIEQLRHMLEQTTAERDNYAKSYEEERKAVGELHENFHAKDQEIENSTNRMLASLGPSVYQDGIADESVSGKMYHIENAMSFLLEKYNMFLSGLNQLKMSMVDFGPDIAMQEEMALFGIACNNLLGLKAKVVDFDQKLVQAEYENKQLMEQLNEHKALFESASEELSKLKAELEQERRRNASTKEKLTLAVTKGKALVQQRDSLKQSLAEKTSELEKCLTELNEKSNALAIAEQNTDLLFKSETLVASLQEAHSEKDRILHTCEEILLNIVETDEYHSMDIIEKVRYLTEERSESNRVSLEFRKLVDALSLFDFPETVKLNGLDSKIVWLLEAVVAAQEEASKLQQELLTMKEAATQEKDYLQVELEDLRVKCDKIAESEHRALNEKDRIIGMLQEASGVTVDDQKEQNQAFSDVAMIVDTCFAKIKDDFSASYNFSNSTVENFEKMQDLLYLSNMNLELYGQILEDEIVGRAEMSSLENELVVLRSELNHVNGEKDSLQKDVERSEEKVASLREKLSMAVKKGKGLFQERENLKKTLNENNTEISNLKLELQEQGTVCIDLREQINRLNVDLERVPQLETDISSIQEQKNQVEKCLEERNSMLQKVLKSIDEVGVPDGTTFDDHEEKIHWLAGYLSESQRANLLADQDLEKARIEARELANEMEEMHVTVTSLKDALSDAERKISVLIEEKEGLAVSKAYVEEELKKAIEESSSLTTKYSEVCATQKSLEDALQAAEMNAAQLVDEKEAAISGRVAAETELEKVKEEKYSKDARDLPDETEDLQITLKSLKEALSAAEIKISELKEEKEGLIVSKTHVEQELKNAIEESSSLTQRFAEVCSNIKSHEDSLQAAERNITQLTDEKEEALSTIASTEIELEKVKEDVTVQTSKLSEADKLKQSLEDALSQAQENLILLAEDNKRAKSNKIDLENELKELKEEVDSHVLRFSDANSTIKSLQDALSNAEEKVSGLVNEKKNAEEEISSLNFRLNACLQELAGTHGSLKSSSMELSGHLSSLRGFLKDETLSSSLFQIFEKKISGLNDMNLLLQEVKESVAEVDSEILQRFSAAEEETSVSTIPSSALGYVLDVETSNGEENFTDADNIVFYVGKTVEQLQLRDKVFAEKVEDFSAFMDNLIWSLFKKLDIVKTMLISMPERITFLKQKVDELESERQALKDNIFMLESYNGSLLPACTDATREMKFEFERCLSELKSNSHLNDISSIESGTFDVNSVGEDQLDLDSNNYRKVAEEILFASRRSRDLNRHFQDVINKMITTVDSLQNELKESKTTSEKLLEERNLSENVLMKLKTDLEKSESVSEEMRVSLEEYKQREKKLKEREADILSRSASSLKKLEEVEGNALSASETKSLLDMIKRIDISPTGRDTGNLQFHGSSDVEKLFHIVESYAGLTHQINTLSGENEKLHTTIDGQVSEMKRLKDECEEHYNHNDEKEKMKNELLDLAIGLESIIQKMGNESVDGKKEVFGVTGLLQVLEKRVVASNMESTNLKTKAEELNYKLLEMQKVVDKLSSKIKLLEDSSQSPETINERGVLESSSSSVKSEISEIQDMGPVAKIKATPPIPPVQSSPHPRTMLRKGSGDHLAISVDSDSELLSEEKNEDKGHVFKSLTTSGCIPRQGKLIADRVDGMWVSGSRALMNRPRARLSLITYWLLVHLFLLGSIL